jgi:hypothetical protein
MAKWVVGCVGVFIAGCAGSAGSSKSVATSTATEAISVTTTTAPTSTADTVTVVTQTAATEPSGSFQAHTFQPSFSVQLPAGWTVAERDTDLAQAYKSCANCLHDGEENGEITIGKDLSSLPPAEAAAHVVTAQTGTAGAIETVKVASYTGAHVVITRPGTSELRFTDNGYHTEATGDPIDLFFIDVGGQTISILVDAHTASGADASAFHEAVTGILQSLSFDG